MSEAKKISVDGLIATLKHHAVKDRAIANELGTGVRSSRTRTIETAAVALENLANAAVERDQALDNLRASEKMREDLRVVLNQVCDERDQAVAIVHDCERDMKALRGRIHALTEDRVVNGRIFSDAPHGPYCSSRTPVPEGPRYDCDCWKAGL